jgi:TetR/AcrR family transcriptional regulator of autoinduction and epiphytic fitness
VAEALLALVEEGNPQPTAKEVAARADVSLRLVFHHFDDMDALFGAVVAMQHARHWAHLEPPDAGQPRPERIDQTVAQRAALFEAIAPVRRAGLRQAQRSERVAADLAESNAILRRLLGSTFAAELGDGDETLAEALDAAASWECWERLRGGQSLSVPAAAAAMARTLHGLLDDGGAA